jgi:uncharacterized membrane protein
MKVTPASPPGFPAVIPARAPRFLFAGIALAAFLAAMTPARADLRVCNATSGRVGLAIGYLDGPVWVTEGWFNLKANRCDTIVRGRLSSRYFYVHAVDYDRGGDWSGPNILCTRDVEFSIRGPLDCYARGYERAGFIEVDTGQQADWTVELGDGGLVSGR